MSEMKIRDSIRILGTDFKIKYVERYGDVDMEDGHLLQGQLRNSKCEIVIKKEMHEDGTTSTLIHEIVEALNVRLSIGLSEQQIEILEGGLFSVLADNGGRLWGPQ